MSTDISTDRRAFLATALATLAALPTATPAAPQAPEVPNYRADVPAGATLWGLAVFTADQPVDRKATAGASRTARRAGIQQASHATLPCAMTIPTKKAMSASTTSYVG
jgi:hypothetical protein